MAREIAISIYLVMFRLLFNMMKLFPQKKKTVCVASFGDNIFYTTKALKTISNEDIVILKEPTCRYKFDSSIAQIILFDLKHPISYVKSIYHLATASTILIDNYFGFLAATKFRKGAICIQLWHAAGAIKQFGLLDPTNELRTEKAKERFQMVYNNFHYSIVGSEKMADTFQASFGLPNDRFLRTGIPRSDILFDNTRKKEIYNEMLQKYPEIRNKKIILYAPTFRNHQLTDYRLNIDIDLLYEELADDYVLFIKPHPAVSYTLNEKHNDFVYDVGHYDDSNELLLIVDLLITDYSSIPFEYALLEKPMIFYAYDIDEYRRTSGLIEDYENEMPGPVVYSTEAIIKVIQSDNFDINKIKSFAIDWNEYSNGHSSMNVARFITERKVDTKEFIPV